jgi:hypothetical protein
VAGSGDGGDGFVEGWEKGKEARREEEEDGARGAKGERRSNIEHSEGEEVGDVEGSDIKKRRRQGVVSCKHGCGFTYAPPPRAQGDQLSRKARDQFDYHELQGCPKLTRLVCPLGMLFFFWAFASFPDIFQNFKECTYRGKVLSFAGPKALRNHVKTKAHQEKVASMGQAEASVLAVGPPKKGICFCVLLSLFPDPS